MLKQSNNKFKKVFKGAVFGMACMLTISGLPLTAGVGKFASQNAGAASVTVDTAGIITLKGAKPKATKGVPYKVTEATFSKGAKQNKPVKDNNTTVADENGLKTDITVKYKNTDFELDLDGTGSFTPKDVGTYTITYSVTDTADGSEYSFDYDVYCEVGKASFEFAENDQNILPSYYDKSVFEEKDQALAPIVLSFPKLLKEDGEEWKDADEAAIKFYKTAPGDASKDYVLVSITGGSKDGTAVSEALTDEAVDNDARTVTIDGEKLVSAGEGAYTVTFTYYQNGVFASSTSKTFNVKTGHYKKSSANNAKSEYELVASFATTTPDSANTGVAVDLPSVRATTASTNAPANEAVNVSYSVKVTRMDASKKYTIDVPDCIEDNKFTAPEDGDYRFEYTITDFYGNSTKKTFYINGVKDAQEPKLFIYNAKDYKELDVYQDNDFASAKQDIKNETVNRNMVVYAIGASDNAIKKGVTLTREIKDAIGYSRFKIVDKIPAQGEDDTAVRYNNYNLIFNFDQETFVADNYAVAQAMQAQDKEDVAKYLKDNNYLIVTHGYKPGTTNEQFTFDGEFADVETDPTKDTFNPEEFKKALLPLGYAYVPYVDSEPYTFSNQTYYLYYSAEDKAGNKYEEPAITMSVSMDKSYTDVAVPTINFPTSLQSVYLPDEKITFEAPRYTDTADDLPNGKVMYRYLDTARREITTSLSKDFTFTVNTNSALVGPDEESAKWYAKANTYTTHGFIALTANEDDSYTIDLSKKPEEAQNAAFVELFVVATDDYGNMGFYQKVMRLSSTGDTGDAPIVKDIKEAENDSVVQGGKITLPTIVYNDDLVDYMTHTVEVYHVTETTVDEGPETVKSYRKMPSEDSHALPESEIHRYTLFAGTFTASYSGNYRAVVTVKDSANNSVATFFDYKVTENEQIQPPVVANLSNESIALDVDQEYILPSPTLTIDERGGLGYAGYQQDDDQKTAKYYTPSAVSAETNNYNLTKYSFSSRASGIYEIKYSVYLISYNKEATSAGIKLVDGTLTFEDGGQTYRILPDMAAGTVAIFDSEDNDVTATKNSAAAYTQADPKLITLETNVQRFVVTDKQAPELHINTTDYTKTYTEADGRAIEIQRITTDDMTLQGIDPEESYVQVVISKASGGTTTLPSIKMKDWDNERDTDDIKYDAASHKLNLILRENGQYTINYHVVDYSGNVASGGSYSFAVGDTDKPEIIVKDGFLDKAKDSYKRGQTVVMNTSFLDISDNSIAGEQADEILKALRDKVEITVTNELGNVEVEKNSDNTFSFKLETAGTYTITVKTTDAYGWEGQATPVTITISADKAQDVNKIYQTVGTILIVVSVVILLAVVAYFVYSKIKLDKEAKGTGKKKNKK